MHANHRVTLDAEAHLDYSISNEQTLNGGTSAFRICTSFIVFAHGTVISIALALHGLTNSK